MTDQLPKAKGRKLRLATETMRERAERATVKNAKSNAKPLKTASRTKTARNRIAHLPVWKPFKFIGRFIIPPYFRASWREIRQVTWPTRRQTRELTGAVIMFSVVFGIIIAAFDYGLDTLFKKVIIK